MQFTTSYGAVIPEFEIRGELTCIIKNLRPENSFIPILSWEKEFLEWYLDKEIEFKKSGDGEVFYIKVHGGITEDDLEQLEQLRDYLEL